MNSALTHRVALLSFLALACVATFGVEFQPPVRVMADGKPIDTERPGYAAPAWVDIDGDGKKDLLVGQFSGGKIRVFKNKGDGTYAAGEFLKAGEKVALVPGVW